jgi:ABC-type branched-subunit amino acid transport system ATPase component
VSALLEIEGLHAGYGDHEILRGVGLRVEAGEIVAIIGPNGAGKSTLLKTIAGLLPPREGAVRFRGEPIGGAPAETIIRRGLCYVPQEANVFPGLSVEDNLVIGGWAATGASAERAAAVSALFPILAERRRQRAGSLSGGERQMLAIARALMVPAKVILLDEPFEGLAPTIVKEVMDALAKLRGRVAMVIVEHHAETVLPLVDRAYVLVNGQVAFEGTAKSLEGDAALQARLLGVVQKEAA